MCDTLVALQNSTKEEKVIFGKNSDRPQTEAQLITSSPRRTYSNDQQLNCTYITIPQVSETAAVILSQPWWMWGAEMGANEHGVVIGNEAVHSHERLRNSGLLGMDLLRLGLERGKSARESLDTIIHLLKEYGQGGGCAYGDSAWKYHNSFLIADQTEAYVLETADMWWVVEYVEDIRSISNQLSIRGKGDERKDGIIEYAIEKSYCKDDSDFDFASTFSGTAPSSSPYSRGGRSFQLLQGNKGNINEKKMMDFLRDHKAGICMHGGFESTGSQVSILDEESNSIHWFTGTTIPCLSNYKPYCFPIKDHQYQDPAPYKNIDQNWVWCRHAHVVRQMTSYFSETQSSEFQSKINNFESDVLNKLKNIIKEQKPFDFEKISKINEDCWKFTENLL